MLTGIGFCTNLGRFEALIASDGLRRVLAIVQDKPDSVPEKSDNIHKINRLGLLACPDYGIKRAHFVQCNLLEIPNFSGQAGRKDARPPGKPH
ncbi:MAG TPA: hypothetical protein VF268_10615 [Gammaproteobacteria bacterium]